MPRTVLNALNMKSQLYEVAIISLILQMIKLSLEKLSSTKLHSYTMPKPEFELRYRVMSKIE